MQKGLGIVVVVVILAIIGVGIYFSVRGSSSGKSDNTTVPSSSGAEDTIVDGAVATLYFGKGCPHCEKLDKWLSDNQVAGKIKYNVKEVWYNQTNSAELSEKARACNISGDKVGVPFLYDVAHNKCYTGEVEVQNFFSALIK